MLLLLGNSNAEAIGAQKTIHMPIAMTIADEAMIIRSIVSHDGICVEGCSSIAPSLYPGTSLPRVAQRNVRSITREGIICVTDGSARSSPGKNCCPHATASNERHAGDEKQCFGPRQYPNVTHGSPQPLGITGRWWRYSAPDQLLEPRPF